MNKPYSESCDQNKTVILDIVSPIFSSLNSVLEIGSGTGQHAVFFAENMPGIRWYTSDRVSYLDGINMWLEEAGLPNVVAPIELDVSKGQWPSLAVDAVFSANSLHIMSVHEVESFMSGVGKLLNDQGQLLIYGPFNYAGTYTSESNRRFDQWLKNQYPDSCIKHFEDIVSLASASGMSLVADHKMPANNRILHFLKN